MDITPSVLTIALTLPHPLLPFPSKRWKEIVRLAASFSYNDLVFYLDRQKMLEEVKRLDASWVKQCCEFIFEGKCLSIFCEGYPLNWKRSLGDSAPPSVWCNQVPVDPCASCVSIVGNRKVGNHAENWTFRCAYTLAKMGICIVSGGAMGVDRAAAKGSLEADRVPVEILPFGIHQCNDKYPACRLSVCAPNSVFSTRNAMVRNKLIYAYSPHTVVVQSGDQEGGTWHGAINALQKKISCIHVWDHVENKGFSKLVESGAVPFKNLDELIFNLQSFTKENILFSI